MSEMWWWILAGCAAAYGIKMLGFLVPEKLLENEKMTRAAGALTIGLLASLTTVNTVASGASVVLMRGSEPWSPRALHCFCARRSWWS